MKTPRRRELAIIQGLYLFFAGIWPLLSMKTFVFITGYKTDLWLVIMVGLLLAVIGAALGSSGIRKKREAEFALLGIGTSASLALLFLMPEAIGESNPGNNGHTEPAKLHHLIFPAIPAPSRGFSRRQGSPVA